MALASANGMLDNLKRGPDLGLVASIVVVLSVVTIPGSLFIPLPDPNDPSGLGQVIYVPVLALGVGLAAIDIVWLLRYLIRRKPAAGSLAVGLVAVVALAAYIVCMLYRYL